MTTATTLYQMGVDEQLIKERTRHRSDTKRSYTRTGSELDLNGSVCLAKLLTPLYLRESLDATPCKVLKTKANDLLGALQTVFD